VPFRVGDELLEHVSVLRADPEMVVRIADE
jgi:hypothetical protein